MGFRGLGFRVSGYGLYRFCLGVGVRVRAGLEFRARSIRLGVSPGGEGFEEL